MTTAQIETAADPSSVLAPADVDLKVLLRYKVVPDFYEQVGYAWWRRKQVSLSISANATYVSSTAGDIGHIRSVYLSSDTDNELDYIGDREDLIVKARVATVASKPTQYWHQLVSTTEMRFYFGAPSDGAYTMLLGYDSHIVFADDTSSVDLAAYIPKKFHWALVEGLKRELYERRFGDGDSRYQRADAEWQRLTAQAMESMEDTRGRRVSFAG